jgi:hypothetical protein
MPNPWIDISIPSLPAPMRLIPLPVLIAARTDTVEPRLKQSNKLNLLASLPWLLNDSDEPAVKKSTMLIALPNLPKALTLILDPIEVADKTLIAL